MNQVLQDKLAELLELGKQGALQIVDILKEQMPDLIEQILRWEFIQSLGKQFLSIMFLLVGIMWLKSFCKYAKNIEDFKYFNNIEPWHIYGLPMWAGLAISAVGFFKTAYNFTWLQILLAPKLYLIQYISNLIK